MDSYRNIGGRSSIHNRGSPSPSSFSPRHYEHIRRYDRSLVSSEDELNFTRDTDDNRTPSPARNSSDSYECRNRTASPVRSANTTRSPSGIRKPLPNFVEESQTPVTTTSSNNWLWIVAIFVFTILMAAVYHKSTEEEGYKNCTYDAIQKEYPLQSDKVWHSLTVGIEHILNRRTQMPAVFLFVHEDDQQLINLIKKITHHTSQCFGTTTGPIEIRNEDFASERAINDYGYIVEKYTKLSKQGHVILIGNLNKIPAEAARALHSICDTHSPIAKNVVIFLTLTTTTSAGINPLDRAVQTLTELWGSKLRDYELGPIITRVTDQVLELQN